MRTSYFVLLIAFGVIALAIWASGRAKRQDGRGNGADGGGPQGGGDGGSP